MIGLQTCRNPVPAGKDELTEKVLIKGSGTSTFIPAVLYTPIPILPQVPALVQALALTPGLPSRYTDEDLQRATKLALKLFIKG